MAFALLHDWARMHKARSGERLQVRAIQETAQRLSDVSRLNKLHYHAASGQYRDWGNHTEAASMQWAEWKGPEGRVVRRAWVRAVGRPDPSPQLVPHFGYGGLADALNYSDRSRSALATSETTG